MSDECAAAHPSIDPWGWAWADTEKWDMANANWRELDDREPDIDLVLKAMDASNAGRYSEATPIWINLAERGSVRSMLELGICHEFGCGVLPDHIQAENWYKQAAAGGSQYATLRRAHLAAKRQNFTECEAILQSRVSADWASALFWRAWYRIKQSDSKENYQSIYQLLKVAAKEGHPGAQAVLANFMVRGKFGLLRSPLGFIRATMWAIASVKHH